MLDDFDIKMNKAVFSSNSKGIKSSRVAVPMNFLKDIGVDENNRDIKVIKFNDFIILVNSQNKINCKQDLMDSFEISQISETEINRILDITDKKLREIIKGLKEI